MTSANRRGKEIFIDICEAVNDYLRENLPDVPRTVEEIEAIVFVQFAAMAEHYDIDEGKAREAFVQNARKRLAVPAAERRVCHR